MRPTFAARRVAVVSAPWPPWPPRVAKGPLVRCVLLVQPHSPTEKRLVPRSPTESWGPPKRPAGLWEEWIVLPAESGEVLAVGLVVVLVAARQ